MKSTYTLLFLLFAFAVGQAQVTLYTENFQGGGGSFTLNTNEIGGTATPNFWVVNNAYTGGTGSVVCFGFPLSYTITNTPNQPAGITGSPNSFYLHTMSIYGQADNIFCSSFAAADGFCIFNSSNFARMNTPINTQGYQNVTLQFWWNCAGGSAIYGELYYSINGGAGWTLASTPISQYWNQSTWVQQTVTLPIFDNVADLRFGFRFVNQTSSTAADPGFSIDDIVVTGTLAPLASINTGNVSSLTLCPGNSIQVPFTASGIFNAGNVFTAELSDASGSFATPVQIGSMAGTASGTISATIPLGTPSGAGYRVRVIGSNPAVTGTDNALDIAVLDFPVGGTASPMAGNICAGSSTQINLSGATGTLAWESSPNGISWSSFAGNVNPLPTGTLAAPTYFRAVLTNACGFVYSDTVLVTVTPSNQGYATGGLSRDSICDGDTTTVQVIYHGGNIQWYTSTDGGGTWALDGNSDPSTLHTIPLSGTHANAVMAVVDNGPCGIDSIVVPIAVEYVAAGFTYVQTGGTVTFVDASTNAMAWSWNFGDGNTSTLQNPTHTYAPPGPYTATLLVTGPFGCTAQTDTLIILPVGLDEGEDPFHVNLYPNPFAQTLHLELETPAPGYLHVALLDAQGRMIRSVASESLPTARFELEYTPDAELAAGVYFLRIAWEGQSLYRKLILQR